MALVQCNQDLTGDIFFLKRNEVVELKERNQSTNRSRTREKKAKCEVFIWLVFNMIEKEKPRY